MLLRNLWPVLILRLAVLIPLFVVGCPLIVLTQLLGFLVFRTWFPNPGYLQAVINVTKTHFIILLTFISQVISPTTINVTYDPNVVGEGAFTTNAKNQLVSHLRPNLVIILNHQIYTDWLYLWFIAYTSQLSSCIYIVLKDLSKIPVLGQGMKNYNFLFLSRKWAADKPVLTRQLGEIDANARGVGPANGVTPITEETKIAAVWPPLVPEGQPKQVWPYELLIFPEGTVMLNRTVNKLREFCKEQGRKPLENVLLPRVRGLFLALRKLRHSVEFVYDFTTGYGDLGQYEFGEDKFLLKRFYLRGYGPPSINYYVDAYKLSEIPLGAETDDVDDADPEDLRKFDEWLSQVWYAKDARMQQFYEHGKFVAKNSEVTVLARFGLYLVLEIVRPFLPVVTVLLVLRWVVKFLYKTVVN